MMVSLRIREKEGKEEKKKEKTETRARHNCIQLLVTQTGFMHEMYITCPAICSQDSETTIQKKKIREKKSVSRFHTTRSAHEQKNI